jgi:hypothetical protein
MHEYIVRAVREAQPAVTTDVEVTADNIDDALKQARCAHSKGRVFSRAPADITIIGVTQVVDGEEVTPGHGASSASTIKQQFAILTKRIEEARRHEMDPKEPMFKIQPSDKGFFQVMPMNQLVKEHPGLYDTARMELGFTDMGDSLASMSVQQRITCPTPGKLFSSNKVYIQRVR